MVGGLMLGSCESADGIEFSEREVLQIEGEIRQAAIDHLNARDLETALSHYSKDAIAVSNDILYGSIEEVGEHLRAFYDIFKEVNIARWDEMHITVISREASIVTAKFRYSFTSVDNEKMDFQGVWTSLYVLCNGSWKIRVHHESFDEVK